MPLADIARVAAALKAPLGVYSINGNHDWWSDGEAQRLKKGPPQTQRAFEDAGIPVLVNRAVRLVKDGYPFWVSGTDSMISYITEPDEFHGTDNLPATLAHVTDDAPIIHLAHEPDMFAKIPERVSLTLAGHTHGGQVRVLGRAPFTPSHYGRSHSYGHIIENDRHLIVSGGLGTSTIPIRLGVPPEINLLELG